MLLVQKVKIYNNKMQLSNQRLHSLKTHHPFIEHRTGILQSSWDPLLALIAYILNYAPGSLDNNMIFALEGLSAGIFIFMCMSQAPAFYLWVDPGRFFPSGFCWHMEERNSPLRAHE